MLRHALPVVGRLDNEHLTGAALAPRTVVRRHRTGHLALACPAPWMGVHRPLVTVRLAHMGERGTRCRRTTADGPPHGAPDDPSPATDEAASRRPERPLSGRDAADPMV